MYNSKIIGMGHFVPKLSVSNNDLAQIMATSDQWIYSRTGIRNRYIAVEETNYELAAGAGLKAIENAGLRAKDIDLIIVGTFSADYGTPSVACLVQKELGIGQAMCFDVSAACSGFSYAIDVADQFIKTGKYKTALVIGSERLSQLLDWEDRGTCVLFGDGAGATVMERTEDVGVIDSVNYAMGEGSKSLYVKNTTNTTPYYKGNDEHHLVMNGQEVFQFACTKVPETIKEILEKNSMAMDEIDLFILHQANARIISKIAKRLKVNIDKFYMNMHDYGNTSAASIPIALSELSEQGKLEGKKVLTAGFGAGLTYGCNLIQF